MDRWKSRGGKSQRKEEKRREEKKREEKKREEKKRRREKRRREERREEERRKKKEERRKKIREEEESEEESEERRCRRAKRYSIKIAIRSVFPGFGGWKNRLVKRRVQSHLAKWEMKNCTPLWREAHFEVKSVKSWRSRTTFRSWDVFKVHGVAVRSTFGSQMYKTPHVRTTFGSWDVWKVNVVVAGSTFRSQNLQKTPASEHFWKLRYWKTAHRCGAMWFCLAGARDSVYLAKGEQIVRIL